MESSKNYYSTFVKVALLIAYEIVLEQTSFDHC